MFQLPEQQGPDRGLRLVKKVGCYLDPTMQGGPSLRGTPSPAACCSQGSAGRHCNGGDVELWGRGKQQQAFAIRRHSALPGLWVPQ